MVTPSYCFIMVHHCLCDFIIGALLYLFLSRAYFCIRLVVTWSHSRRFCCLWSERTCEAFHFWDLFPIKELFTQYRAFFKSHCADNYPICHPHVSSSCATASYFYLCYRIKVRNWDIISILNYFNLMNLVNDLYTY